ncbi:MAG: hypothetical protein HY925_12725 [Elusimicrobia bacterium]|nr:hypothetical protein [Elusimicrobiota bacterium]
MNTTIEPTRSIALQVWWAWFWRAAIGTFVAAFAVGLLLGVAGLVLGFDATRSRGLMGGLSMLVAFPVSVEMLYRVLRKRFSTFQISIQP